MKKKFFSGIALLTVFAMIMVGCQKGNTVTPDEPETPQEQEQEDDDPEEPTATAVAALLDYQIEITDAMFEVANFNISYYDKNGQLQTEQMTGTKWDTIIVAALPAKLGVRVTTTPKDNIDSTKYSVFTVLRKYTYVAYAVDAEGKQIGTDQPFPNNSHVDMPGSQIESFFSREKAFHQVLYTFDEEGNKEFHSNWE